jgi:hypothetical protein
MEPGQVFAKTWRLENVGSCTWTRLYKLVYFSGNSLNAYQTHYLLAEVKPGQQIDLTVDMVAPQTPGIYQSNWMLTDPEGEYFGIGPNGDAPFWVQIEVTSDLTETPQPSPTLTPTPIVYLSGAAQWENGDRFDLDTGNLNPEVETLPDLEYVLGSEPIHVFKSLNGTVWTVYGTEVPSFKDCITSPMISEDIPFNETPIGTYICYRTSQMLPGRILIEGFTGEILSISFLTWSVP